MSRKKKKESRKKQISTRSFDDVEVTYSKGRLFNDKSKKRQNYIKKRRTKKITASLAVFVVILIFLSVITVNLIQGKFTSKIKTSYIQFGVIERKHKANVYFLREEHIIKSNAKGIFIPQVNEGEKVGKGQVIGHIVAEGMEELLKELRSIEKRIYAAEDKKVDGDQFLEDDFEYINEELDRLNLSLVEMSLKSNLEGYTETKREIERLLVEYKDLVLDRESKDSYINELQSKRRALKSSLEGKMFPVEAIEAGIISFYMDSKSSYVSRLTMDNLDLEDLNNLKGNLSYTANKKVENDQSLARISPNVSYIMAFPKDKSNEYSLNKDIIIKSRKDGYEVKASLVKITDDLVFLETNKSLANSISNRFLDAEVILQKQEGMKVPIRSLTDWDQAMATARITLIRSGYVEYNYVSVLARDKEYAIVAPSSKFDDNSVRKVQYNDLYIVNYEKVQEGEFIK